MPTTTLPDLPAADPIPGFDVDAYLDGYQTAIEPGWPDPSHFNTESWDQGSIDGRERFFGEDPDAVIVARYYGGEA